MFMRRLIWTCGLFALLSVVASTAGTTDFQVGAADKDITPPPGIPMWGYGARTTCCLRGLSIP